MELETCLRRELFLSCDGIVLVDDFQGFQHVAALVVKVLRHVGKPATAVSRDALEMDPPLRPGSILPFQKAFAHANR